MKCSELSNEILLFAYSNCLKQIEHLYAEKKELEKEIASRYETLKERYQRGEITRKECHQRV